MPPRAGPPRVDGVTELHVLYAVVGLAAVALALLSRRLRDLPVSEVLVALVLGVALGPAALGWITLTEGTRDVVLLEGSRVLLAASVMAAALRYPVRSLAAIVRPTALLLLVAMPLAAALAGAAAMLVGLPLALAAVVVGVFALRVASLRFKLHAPGPWRGRS